MLPPFYFAIVGPKDNPLFELESDGTLVVTSESPMSGAVSTTNTPPPGSASNRKEEHRHLNQFILHAALDVLEDAVWTTNQNYLKVIDRFNDWLISGYILPTNIRFMLLHDTKNDDGIKNFFMECHELFIKILLNPFHDLHAPITNTLFDTKVRAIAKKHLQ